MIFYSRFRNHPSLSKSNIQNIALYEACEAATSAKSGFLTVRDSKITSFVCINEIPWESAFFGVRMGRMTIAYAAGASIDMLISLIMDAIEIAKSKYGIEHVSANIDIDDYTSLNCLVKLGFDVMDLKRTYVTNTINKNSIFEKRTRCVRPYTASDRSRILDIVDASDFQTRYSRDEFLDNNLVKAFYRKWFENLLSGAGRSAHVLVYHRNGEIVACGGIGETTFSQYGVDLVMRSGSMYASLPSGVGGYGPVIYQMTIDALQSHGLIESSISLNNTAAIRVVESIRPNRSVTTYCLRKHCN